MDKEQDPQASAEKERREIVEQYDKGQDEDSCKGIDQKSIIDEYGFIHKGPLPQKSQKESQVKTSKWIQMTNEWAKHANGLEMKTAIYKGIPNKLRGRVYRHLLGIDKVKEKHGLVYQKS